jgi:hypothetical protein
MTRALAGVSVLAASLTVSAMFVLARPNVIVVAPFPVVPLITSSVTTTAEFSVDQIEEAVVSSIAPSELSVRRVGLEVAELE